MYKFSQWDKGKYFAGGHINVTELYCEITKFDFGYNIFYYFNKRKNAFEL